MIRAILLPVLIAVLVPLLRYVIQLWLLPLLQRNAQRRDNRHTQRMTRQEALETLGLDDHHNEEDIDRAWRNLMNKVHPDKGGNEALAQRLNEARHILKKHR